MISGPITENLINAAVTITYSQTQCGTLITIIIAKSNVQNNCMSLYTTLQEVLYYSTLQEMWYKITP